MKSVKDVVFCEYKNKVRSYVRSYIDVSDNLYYKVYVELILEPLDSHTSNYEVTRDLYNKIYGRDMPPEMILALF